MSDTQYRFTMRPLTKDEGGGYLIEFPDLPGCMSDGGTIEEAIANGEDAKRCWIAAMKEAGRPITPPLALIDHSEPVAHRRGCFLVGLRLSCGPPERRRACRAASTEPSNYWRKTRRSTTSADTADTC
jgi:predicted RNase H-like HicB family nuclease